MTISGFDAEILSKWEDASYFDLLEFKERIQTAKLTGENVVLPGIELSMSLDNAELFAQIWEKKHEESQSHAGGGTGVEEKKPKKLRSVLLLEDNKETVTYIEERAEELRFNENTQPLLPKCIRPDIKLKEHQNKGVAWLKSIK